MEDALSAMGAVVLIIWIVLFGFWAYEIELVMPSTFKEGLVKIDDDISYTCVPTDRTKKLQVINKQIEALKKEKK